jgi:hypothetical protein
MSRPDNTGLALLDDTESDRAERKQSFKGGYSKQHRKPIFQLMSADGAIGSMRAPFKTRLPRVGPQDRQQDLSAACRIAWLHFNTFESIHENRVYQHWNIQGRPRPFLLCRSRPSGRDAPYLL